MNKLFQTQELLQAIQTGHIGEALLSYAMIKIGGDVSATIKKGLWKDTVDDHWNISCNGTADKLEGQPPFSWFIEFNGWPAGSLSVITGEGCLCAGDLGNEENLKKALFESITSHLKKTA